MNGYPTLSELTASRRAERRKRAVSAAGAALAMLAADRIEARVTGSLAREEASFGEWSDVDLLILSPVPEAQRGKLWLKIESLMGGLPFDLIFADEVDDRLLSSMLKGAKDARTIH